MQGETRKLKNSFLSLGQNASPLVTAVPTGAPNLETDKHLLIRLQSPEMLLAIAAEEYGVCQDYLALTLGLALHTNWAQFKTMMPFLAAKTDDRPAHGTDYAATGGVLLLSRVLLNRVFSLGPNHRLKFLRPKPDRRRVAPALSPHLA
jgi:hypothetical protein